MLAFFQRFILTSLHFINLFVLSIIGICIGAVISGSLMLNALGLKEVREGSFIYWLANIFNLLSMLIVMFYLDMVYLTYFF